MSTRDAAAVHVREAEAVRAEVEVRATTAGRVLAIAVHVGDHVDSGASLATILRGDTREIAFGVIASQASTIADGAAVTWRDAAGVVHSARVRAIVPRVDSTPVPAISSLLVVARARSISASFSGSVKRVNSPFEPSTT